MNTSIQPRSLWKPLLLVLGTVLLAVWLAFTPPGLLGKADALAYSVCHRFESHSLHVGARQLPLCARCTGMYLGALLGLVFQLPRGRRGGMPARKFWPLLALLFLAFAFDGVNSFSTLIPGVSGLYAPSNTLRLITGTGMGLVLALLLYPIVQQTLFVDFIDQPAFSSWRQVGLLALLAAALDVVLLSGSSLALYPLGFLSGLGVPVLLGLCYSLVWLILFKREGTLMRWRAAWPVLAAGGITALAQIALIDWGRLALTGTWGGFPLGPF